MTDFQRRVLAILSEGPKHAEELGKRLWPGRFFRSSSNGGPWGGAVCASYQLSKMALRTGWVAPDINRRSTYRITREGEEALADDLTERTWFCERCKVTANAKERCRHCGKSYEEDR